MSRLGVAIVAAGAFLAGVLLVAVLGGAKNVVHEKTVTVRSQAAPSGTGGGAGGNEVPDVVGQPLDAARDRLDRAGFDTDEQGAGPLGVLVPENWVVVAQSPEGGDALEQGGTVQLEIQHL